ncbi:hypothetical protein FC84_GL000754 [Lapidilactobacillus dextrinicus DSM 20335]|uniref:Glycosyltransferase 2-like domain-containing protein n=1 Tax=Lapidilactobacillus dextrinicus DSM 20335 TaxID=1423738 RepID=A0A0R2BGT0_9LACO|nr:glycosyltransferase family 2 protein [Lapidilactobacillus dextrinicus]KRM78497.1 hypothetical protein FC84_GL000754 [Lapidilactobacillus dextrinicus DSM 20335]QFG46175.1 glycosyltransferase family 2 protein [Lapidilactobacillus dextrinicus]
MTKPLVSIIISIYNVAPYLQRCLDSLVQQDYPEIELLLIDDGATDKSGEICDEYVANNSLIHVFHKVNGGLADTRNYGLQQAHGEYVIFFDGDDFADIRYVSTLVTAADSIKADITGCGYYVEELDRYETTLSRTPNPFIDGRYTNMTFQQIPVDATVIQILGYTWNKLYRRQFLQQQQLSFEKGLSLIEDIDFNARAFAKAEQLVFIKTPLVYYCQRPRRTLGSAANYERPFLLRQRALNSVRELLTQWQTPTGLVEQTVSTIYVDNVKSYIIMLNQSGLSKQSRLNKLIEIMNQPDNRYFVKQYQPQGWQGRLVKFLLQQRRGGWLLRLEQLRHS